MLALPELQSCFYAAMLTPQVSTDLDHALSGDTSRKLRRLEAYRRNVFANLCSALALTYPVVQRIVGEVFFREMARAYVRAKPSLSGDLNDYGVSFSDFVSAYPHAADLRYLADVARLEWQLQLIDLAADTPTATEAPFAALATTPADRYDALFFDIDPVATRLDSKWPLADIWRVNQVDFSGDMQVDFSRACPLLLWRTAGRVEIAALGRAEATLLDELVAGRALAPAVTLALEVEENFELGVCLQRWIAAGVLRGANFDPDRS